MGRTMPDPGVISMVRARGTAWTIDGLASGSGDALRALYNEMGASLYRTAYRMVASQQDAEDVVHDLFVGLPELLSRYEDRGRLESWLKRVVVRMCLMRLRQPGWSKAVPIDESLLATSSDQPRVEFAADLERALGKLPEQLRTIFVLRQLEGYSHEEIAQLTNISAGASRVRYSRALERLRQHLER